MAKGWVKLHRKTLENVELMNDERAFNVFMKLLMLANSKGQVAESGRDLSRLVSTKYTTLYKVLNRLEMYGCISKQSGKQSYTLISICKWNEYQSVSKHYGKQPVSTGYAHGKQLTGVPRIENKNKESDEILKRNLDESRASRLTAERVRQQLKERGILK